MNTTEPQGHFHFITNHPTFFLTLLLSLPSSYTIATYYQPRQVRLPDYEEDEDETSWSNYRHLVYNRLLLATILTVLGSALSTIEIVGTHPTARGWLRLAIWSLLLLQTFALWIQRRPSTRFSLGLLCSVTHFVTVLDALYPSTHHAATAIRGIQELITHSRLATAVGTGVILLLIPRRPTPSGTGGPVDGEPASSALGLLALNWTEPFIKRSEKVRQVELGDVPELSTRYQAREIEIDCLTKARVQTSAPLTRQNFWMALGRMHRNTILAHIGLVSLMVFLGFIPPFTLFHILRALEARDGGEGEDAKVWGPVVALGVSLVVLGTLRAVRYWVFYRSLVLRAQQHLFVAIYLKAMCLSSHASGRPSTSARMDEGRETEEEGHNVINLLAVDAKRLAGFLQSGIGLYETQLQLLISLFALIHLLGWQSLLAGILALLALAPLDIYSTRRFAAAQVQLMQARDRKMTAVTEALQGIRQIKFSGLERQWEERIGLLRESELQSQAIAFVWYVIRISLYLLSPILLSTVALTTYARTHGGLPTATAFTAVAMLDAVQGSLAALPSAISHWVESLVSADRIRSYLNGEESVAYVAPSDTIEFHDAVIAWPRGTAFLRNLNLQFPRDGLSIITGPTASGKSLLLAAILGDVTVLGGVVKGPTGKHQPQPNIAHDDAWLQDGRIAYVAQEPWIEVQTVQENILFGLPLDPLRYTQVILACSLDADLASFSDGDKTEIGPRGVNLSGGQRSRLALARALYSRARFLILDDIFSAVDVHTARHLLDYALTGALAQGRTRILVTHHADLCRGSADYTVHVDRGTAYACQLLPGAKEAASLPSSPSPSSLRSSSLIDIKPDSPFSSTGRQFIQPEHREKGRVKWRIFLEYAKQSGTLRYWLLLVASFSSYSIAMLLRGWYLSVWAEHGDSSTLARDVSIYAVLSLLVCIIGSTRSCFAFSGSLRASRRLFHRLLHPVLRAPLHWIDTTPLGRIQSRFTADFNAVDSQLADDVRGLLSSLVDILMAAISGITINPLLLLAVVPLTTTGLHYIRRYLTAARELKRLDSTLRSPIFEHVTSSITGIATIRAFGRTAAFTTYFKQHIDNRTRTLWYIALLREWLAYRMDMLGSSLSIILTILIVLFPIKASLAGFAITFTLRLANSMSLGVHRYVALELNLQAVERVLDYCALPAEKDSGAPAPPDWPSKGVLEVCNLVARYSPDLPPVLNDVSFRVESGQRVGIVGRTGAGKSSLALALFRILEHTQGTIKVDGVDINTICLPDLRRALAIIPQNPEVFTGTVRENLDPFGEYTDPQLLDALHLARWDATMKEGSGSSLDMVISAAGENLSQGQRQLLCLARALVRRPKLLVLDEATSAVDKETDGLIQGAIRGECGRGLGTLLVIAHRLSTVADFDQILVLGEGRVVEFGKPAELLGKETGAFRGLVDEDSEAERLRRWILGQCSSR